MRWIAGKLLILFMNNWIWLTVVSGVLYISVHILERFVGKKKKADVPVAKENEDVQV